MADILKEKKQLVAPASIQRKAGIKAGDQLEFKASRVDPCSRAPW